MGRARVPWQPRHLAARHHLWAVFLALAPVAVRADAPAMLVAEDVVGPLQPRGVLKVDFRMRKQIWGDHDGSLYYSVSTQHMIIRIGKDGTPTTVAGTGKPGRSGDGSLAKLAQLQHPGPLWGTRDELFLLDGGDTLLRKIDEGGIISTVRAFNWTHDSIRGIWGDTSGNLWFSYSHKNQNQILRLKADGTGDVEAVAGGGKPGNTGDGGPALKAYLSAPNGLWGDVSGNIYFAEMGKNRIRKITAKDNTITTVAGNSVGGFAGDGGKAGDAKLDCPCDVWGDGYGSLYIADMSNHRIRKVDAAGIISTFAGNGVPGKSGDGGPAVRATLNAPKGVWVDRSGQVYISDTYNRLIRKVDAHGSISSFGSVKNSRGTWSKQLQLGYTAPLGHLIADTGHHLVVQVAKNASTSRFADETDPDNRGLFVNRPQSVCASEHAVFLVDSGNKVVIGVDTKSGHLWPLGRNQLQNPAGCAASHDWLFIADRGNHTITGVHRTTGKVARIAGTGERGCNGGKLGCPYGIALMPNASAMITDPCCPEAFLKVVGLRDGKVQRVAARGKGTAEDMASVALAGGGIWVAGNNDCGLEVADVATGKIHAVELLRRNGAPGPLECVLGIVAPPAPPARVHLLGRTSAGGVALVHASVPSVRLLSPTSASQWHKEVQLVVRWEAVKLWGLLEVRLVANQGSIVLTLGEADVEKGEFSVFRTGLTVADGSYWLHLRSKRWPLVRCYGGPVIVGSSVEISVGTSARAPEARSWFSAAWWALVGSCVVGGLVSIPLCFLRVSLKDYGRLGGAIHYRPREIFGGGGGQGDGGHCGADASVARAI